ncbi:MAG: mechanosensitive ion channel family protein [Saprospiraceae bacterium]|nr:mechanosensitive ion channel family protein [Saprospiraceae bacterium]
MNNSIFSLENVFKNWEESIILYLPKVLLAIIILVLFYLLAKLAKGIKFSFYKGSVSSHREVAKILSSVIYFFLLLSGVFLALQVAGLEKVLTHLLAGAGIVGIIAGFAFKDIASNLFGGLLLKFQNPFKEGDWVGIDGNYGYITDVGWITTTIKTIPGQEVFVPNQIIYSGTFTNYSTWGKRRIILESGVSYGDNLEHVKNTALDEVKNIDGVLAEEGIDFYFTDIGGSTYNFMLRFWVKFQSNDDFCKGMDQAIMHLKKRFEQENISIAYPVTTLDLGVKGGVNIFDKEIAIKS